MTAESTPAAAAPVKWRRIDDGTGNFVYTDDNSHEIRKTGSSYFGTTYWSFTLYTNGVKGNSYSRLRDAKTVAETGRWTG